MSDEGKVTPKANAMTEVLRHPVGALRARIDAVEADALARLRSALGSGSASLRDLDQRLAMVSELDWTLHGMRRRVDAFRKDGAVRLQDLRTRALERLDALPAAAVTALAAAGRARVKDLTRGLKSLSDRQPSEEPTPPPAPRSAEKAA